MAPASELTSHLTREYNRRWGTATKSEADSWRASLTALAGVVKRAGLSSTGIGVELKLPLTDKRIDVSLVGRSQAGAASVALVELKQWESVGPSLFPDNVVVGGREMLHPSVQVGAYAKYLRDSHSAFTEDGFGLAACAYLHNMPARSLSRITVPDTAEDLRALPPVFGREDGDSLATFLADQLTAGNGMELLPKLIHGRFRPSKSLLDGIAAGLASTPSWTLLDEQRVAFNLVRGYVDRARETGEKAVVIVLGGPGTGKSVVAAHLALELSREGRTAVHATGSKAFTTNLRALVPKRNAAEAFFRYFNNFQAARVNEDEFDVLVADEAHRIRKTSNDRFTRADLRSELPQVEELIRAARVSVFFLDERQNVRAKEIGSPAVIRDAAAMFGAAVHEVQLTGQFRCNGCGAYVDWINELTSDGPVAAGPWLGGYYEFRVFDDVEEMEAEVIRRARSGASARLVAGFCWPWSDPLPDGSLVNDVQIGDWERPWNIKPHEQRKPPRPPQPFANHPYTAWATQAERVREIGCIYSAQGFEFDYCGVILGDDLVWRDGRGWVARAEESHDTEISKRRLSEPEVRRLLQHTYRVLLTRGQKGTFAYSVDAPTRQFLHSLISATPQ